jgi:histidinol dehydrogenase
MKIIHVADPASEAAQLRKATIIQDSLLEYSKAIMRDVAQHGDPAVLNYTSKFDGARLDSLQVSEEEMKQAYAQVTKDEIMAVKLMKQRLVKSELTILKRLKGMVVSSNGVRIDRMVKPVTSVGCYIQAQSSCVRYLPRSLA